MLPLILEPEKWERPALLELAESLNGGLGGILAAFRSGYPVAGDPELIIREPGRQEAALALMRTVIDLYEASKGSSSTDLALVRLVNLQYQTVVTVMALVPGPLLAEGRKRAKAWRDAHAIPNPPAATAPLSSV